MLGRDVPGTVVVVIAIRTLVLMSCNVVVAGVSNDHLRCCVLRITATTSRNDFTNHFVAQEGARTAIPLFFLGVPTSTYLELESDHFRSTLHR